MNAGSWFVSFGRVWTAAITAAALTAPAGAQWVTKLYPTHPVQDGGYGTAIAAVPDVNGDDRDDVIVGAYNHNVGEIQGAGRAYLYSGPTGVLRQVFTSKNKQTDGNFGWAVAGIPDVDGDGFGDVAIGAPSEGGAGRVYIFNGKNGKLIRVLNNPHPVASGAFGFSLAGMKDLTGDGRGELVVGAPFNNPGGAPAGSGAVYIYNGATGALLKTVASVNKTADGRFGFALASVPDVNLDGRDDLAVGAPGESTGGVKAGRAYLVVTNTGGIFRVLNPQFQQAGGLFGYSVGGVPDATGNGRGDVVVGAPGETSGGGPAEAGRAYLFDGLTGVRLKTFIAGGQSAKDHFGLAVAGIRDMNNDGRGDILIGGPGMNPGNFPQDAGRVLLYSGKDFKFLRAISAPEPSEGAAFGSSIATLRDINKNNRDEIIVGVPGEDAKAAPDVGRAYVFRQ